VTQLADVLHTLGAMRAEVYVPSTGVFQSRARAAMHQELARHQRPIALVSGRVHRRLRLVALVSAGAAAAVVALGWVAPAGSSLYPIRVAHEHLQLLLPGIDRSSAELSDAESRLADAAAGRNQGASLDAAASLLAAAQKDLPADRGSGNWPRWNGDEAELRKLRGSTTPSDSGAAGAHTGSGGDQHAESDHGGGGTGGGPGSDDSHAASGPPSRDGPGGDEANPSSDHGGSTNSWPGGGGGHPGDGGTPSSPETGEDHSHQ
jgi:hypothetical protein